MFTQLKLKDWSFLVRYWAGPVRMKDAACTGDSSHHQVMAQVGSSGTDKHISRVIVAILPEGLRRLE